MAESEFKPIPGTLMPVGSGINNPAFSPDGESIAFAAPTERLIKRVAVTGGAAATVCAVENAPYGMSWDGADLIFAQPDKGVLRVPANGGQPTLIAAVKNGEIAASPQLLPGGEWVLFTVATAQTTDAWDKAQIVAQSLKTSERKTLISGGAEGRYLPSGHIVYALGGVLFAVPFDVRRMLVTGGPVSVVEGVKRSNSGTTGTAFYAVAANGSLVYLPGPAASNVGTSDLALIDRETGAVQPLKLPAARYEHPRFSPDGKWVAVGTVDSNDASVWIDDVSGAASIRRLTLNARNRFPTWSPDSQYVTFQSDREGDLGIWRQRADGTAPAERLTRPDAGTAHLPESWSPDGKTLLFSIQKGAAFTAAALSMPDRTISAFGSIQSAIVFSATFSPDGKWVAYEAKDVSTGAGATRPTSLTQNPLFVQPFPPTGATYLVAENGVHATWSPDGKELFYGPSGGQLLGVAVTTRPSFSFASPLAVPVRFVDPGPIVERTNDISPDGRKFLGVIAAGSLTESVVPVIQVVLNWSEELKQRVPTK